MGNLKDEEFFQSTIKQHHSILSKVARMYCPDKDARPDLIQDMLIQIWLSLSKYNPQLNIINWLYRIALNVAISHYRKSTKKKQFKYIALADQVEFVHADEDPETEKLWSTFDQLIADLTGLDKALMILYLEDKSHTEIAVIMGLSVSNVGTKIARIKNKLRDKYSQLNKNL